MSEASGDPTAMHAALKLALAELLPDLLRQSQPGEAPIAQVPAPPVAAMYRPSGWRSPEPAATSRPVAAAASSGAVEQVRLRDDRDLDAFVRSLAQRLEQADQRAAILAGRLRFSLAGATGSGSAPAATSGDQRIDRGAVTERIVERAAAAGAGIVLGPKAVLTPMGRDRARALGVHIHKEAPC